MLPPMTLLGFAARIAFTVAANLMLKLGADVPEAQRFLFGLNGWKSAVGLGPFGCGGIVYPILLRRVLNLAVSFTAGQFVLVILATSLVLGEPISPARWLGLACICLGIFVVGLTAPLRERPHYLLGGCAAECARGSSQSRIRGPARSRS